MNRLLYWLTGFLPVREIRGDDGRPYLERYYLFSLFGWVAYIHRFVASDPDRGVHDHPWKLSASLVLSTGYLELRAKLKPNGDKYMSLRRLYPGMINVIRGNDFHRILLDSFKPAWTLFVHGPRTKPWGFLRDGIYLTYLEKRNDEYDVRSWHKRCPTGREFRKQPQ